MSKKTTPTKDERLDLLDAKSKSNEEFVAPKVKTYEFYNLEEPGLSIKFPYGPSTNIKKYHLFHGGKHDLPEEVVRHVESCQTPMWAYRPDGNGQMVKQLTGWKSRFQLRQVS